MSDAPEPNIRSAPLDFSGAQGRAYYPRDRVELERLLGALPEPELALFRLPNAAQSFSTRIDPQQIVESGFERSMCHGFGIHIGNLSDTLCGLSILQEVGTYSHLKKSNSWPFPAMRFFIFQGRNGYYLL
jgi:hypothetical protein